MNYGYIIQQLGSTNHSFHNFGFLGKTASVCISSATSGLQSLNGYDTYGSDMKGSKRMCSDMNVVDNSEHSTLELSLGPLPKSSDSYKVPSTVFSNTSSMQGFDEESPFSQGLMFQFYLGKQFSSPNISCYSVPKAHIGNINLNLSLSTSKSESDLTSLHPTSDHHEVSSETSVLSSQIPKNEEGSAAFNCISGSNLTANFDSIISSKKACAKADPVLVIPELPATMVQTEKNSVACTSGTVNVQGTTNVQRRHNTKKCEIQVCGKGARGASGRCIAHGGGRRCQKFGCQRGAEGRTIYCKAHGGGRRCEHFGCTKSAEGRTDFCIGHGGGRRCKNEGCIHAARGKSGLCIKHGGGKRCQIENCTKSAEGSTDHCISHGGGRRCHFPGCTKGAQGSTLFCKAHGGGKRCTFPDCTKGAEGSTPFCKGHGGGKRCSFQGGGMCSKSVHGGTQFCVAHGGGKRCAAPECTKSARGRTNFCVRHGGGKRCKHDGCGKSAQGSTDYCKAHGGGKRCAWGHTGSQFGAGDSSCDKYARGKSGLCTAHAALVQDSCVHGGGKVSLSSLYEQRTNPETVTKPCPSYNMLMAAEGSNGCSGFKSQKLTDTMVTPQIGLFPLPEGRVHGGNLMAMFFNNNSHSRNKDVSEGATTGSGQDAPNSVTSRWM